MSKSIGQLSQATRGNPSLRRRPHNPGYIIYYREPSQLKQRLPHSGKTYSPGRRRTKRQSAAPEADREKNIPVLKSIPVLERDVVVILHRHRSRRRGRLLALRLLVSALAIRIAALAVTIATSLLTIATSPLLIAAALAVITIATLLRTARPEQLHILSHDANTTAALPGLLIFPSILLQAPLNENRTPFREVLGSNLRRAPPTRHVEERCLLTSLALPCTGTHTIHRYTELREGGAPGSCAQLRISRQVTDNHHLV